MRPQRAMKTTVFSSAVLLMLSGINAQPMIRDNARAMPYFAVGFNYLPDMTDFTDEFPENVSKDFSEFAPSFGLGHTISSRWVVIEKEFGLIPWADSEDDSLESEYGMGYARGAIGLNILPPDRLIKLYPAVGVGVRVSHLSVHRGEAQKKDTIPTDKIPSVRTQGGGELRRCAHTGPAAWCRPMESFFYS